MLKNVLPIMLSLSLTALSGCFPIDAWKPCGDREWPDGCGDSAYPQGEIGTDTGSPIATHESDSVVDDTAIDDSDDTEDSDSVDGDGDGWTTEGGDCDDANAEVNPAATEACNGVDDDCDGEADEAGSTGETTWYADSDNDGYGDPELTVDSCETVDGYVADGSDCDDVRSDIHPGAEETDCTDPTDYNCDGSVGAIDSDGDGFVACLDCDDENSAVNPGSTEACNGVDDDCDSEADEAGSTGETTWYADGDADGYGDFSSTADACDAPEGYVADASDCDDTSAEVNPAATEACNGVDDDCDSEADEGVLSTWYADADDDGYGNASSTAVSCDPPEGFVADATDCDDGNAMVHPDAVEYCKANNDCDGDFDEAVDALTWYTDADEDGYGIDSSVFNSCSAPDGNYSNTGGDCDDTDNDINPGEEEVCGNDLDDDCDSSTPDDSMVTYYRDADGDGFGNEASFTSDCGAPDGYVADSSDCDDGDAAVHPSATEYCNGADDDCDGSVDDDLPEYEYYLDADDDSYGDPDRSATSCSAPTGYVDNDYDCDDGEALTYPGAEEVCGDGEDNNCDTYVDYLTAAMLEDYGVGYLVFTELMVDPLVLSDANGEFSEIWNVSDGCDISLDGLYYYDSSVENCALPADVIADGDFYLVGRNAAAAGGVDYVCPGVTLSNAGDNIAIQTSGGTVLDEVVFTSAWPLVEGHSMSLCWNHADATSNDSSANWYSESANVMAYGDYGTPRAENETCAILPFHLPAR